MYKVIAIKDNISYTLHDSNPSKSVPKIASGSIVKEINSISSFSFKIYPDNPCFNTVYPYSTLIQVYNKSKSRYDFIGRVLKIKPSMSSKGLISKTVTCEDRLGYLQDSIQPYVEEKYWEGDDERTGLEEFIDYILDVHNSQVDDYKKIYRGNVTVKPFESSDNITKGLNYETTWDIIQNKLIDSFDGEIQLREENNILYLDYLEEIGEEKTTSIELKKNMKSIDQEIDPTSFATRLIPLGAKLKVEVTDDDGNVTEEETEERLTIADVNDGSIFIDSSESSSLGYITKTVEFDDVTVASTLYKKGLEYLEEINQLTEKNTVKALDLSLINKDDDDFEVGNYYPVKNDLINLDENLRVIKKTINVVEPLSSTFELGDTQKTLSSLTLEKISSTSTAIEEVKKNYVKNTTLSSELTTLISLINQTSSEILLSVQENYALQSDYSSTAQRLAELLIQVDSIQQTVSGWGDLTSTVENSWYVELPDAMEGDLLYLSIRGQVDFLYPEDDLYPSDDLYPIADYLVLEYEDGTTKKITLPFTSLNYIDEDTYDEFIIDSNEVYVIRRVEIDEDGNMYALEEEITETYDDIEIYLLNGLNTIKFLSFDDTILTAKYVVKNILSDVYATTVQLSTSITQLSDSITLLASKTVGKDEIISCINQTAEEIQILASKLSLIGITINMTADNINITSDNLKITSDGSIKVTDSTAESSWTYDEDSMPSFIIQSESSWDSNDVTFNTVMKQKLFAGYRHLLYHRQTSDDSIDNVYGIYETTYQGVSTVWYRNSSGDETGFYTDTYTYIDPYVVTATTISQTSLASKKKNIELFSNALDLINNTDIYKYNFKFEEDTDKKHIGLVIGNDYNTPDEVVSKDGNAIDTYSLISVCLQAIKEQQEQIESLEERITKLEEAGDNG